MSDASKKVPAEIEAGVPESFTFQQIAEITANGVCQAYAAYNNGNTQAIDLPGYTNINQIMVHEVDPNINPFTGLTAVRTAKVETSLERLPIAYAPICSPPSTCTVQAKAGTPSSGYQLFGFTAQAKDGSHNILILRGTVTMLEAGYDLLGWGDNTTAWLPSQWWTDQTNCGNVNAYLYSFYQDPDTVYTTLAASCMNAIAATLDTNPGKPWFVGGHSLGGAMASLAALDGRLAGQLPKETVVCTFGSLHVGDQSWASAYTKQTPISVRFANLCDFVPSMVSLEPLTPTDPYVHVGTTATIVWQNWDDWANHSLSCVYLPMVTTYWNLITWGSQNYPQ